MARPRKDGMDYFPHDTDAVNDEKIEAMRAMHGNDGYAFYFILLERIYRAENAELDISKQSVRLALAAKVGITWELFNSMIETAIDIELFDRGCYEGFRVLTSEGIKKRHEDVKQLRERWRKKKGKPSEIDTLDGVIQGENHVENAEVTGEIKLNKTKVNQIKENNADVEDSYLRLIGEFCDLHQKGEWQLKDNERGAMLDLLNKSIPLDYIITTMTAMYEKKLAEGDKVTSFTFYHSSIDKAWTSSQNPKAPQNVAWINNKQRQPLTRVGKQVIPMSKPTESKPINEEELEALRQRASKRDQKQKESQAASP